MDINNFEFDAYYIFGFILLTSILLNPIFEKKVRKQDVYEFIDDNIDDPQFRYTVSRLTKPRVGEVVETTSSPWYGMLGYITKVNDNDTYNVKITKSMNLHANRIPKHVIQKYEDELTIF
jgi:Ribonuclease G/E